MAKSAAIYCGHGKSQNGSFDVGTTYQGKNEAAMMLPITQAAVKYARASGITVYTDVDTGENNNMNMIEQVKEADKKKADVFVSIHCDWYKAPTGTLPLYISDKGKKLATCINNHVMKDTGIKTRGLQKRTDLYELKQTDMPACIFECGSIKHDVDEWDTAKEIDAYGKAIAKGICEYLGVKFKDTSETKPVTKPKETKSTLLTNEQQQYFLKCYCGYYTGEIDGVKGSKHKQAIKDFKKANGLTVNDTWDAKADALARKLAKELQELLNANGAKLTVDGIIGAKTMDAVKTFQKAKGLTVDGIAGAKTFKKLKGANTLTFEKSKYFEKSEFKCKCGKYCNGYPATISTELLWILEELRKYYGKPVTITSGLRCKKHNNSLPNSSKTSKHLTGDAADIYIAGICDTASGRNQVKAKAYALGAAYSYCNTSGMGNAVHINV